MQVGLNQFQIFLINKKMKRKFLFRFIISIQYKRHDFRQTGWADPCSTWAEVVKSNLAIKVNNLLYNIRQVLQARFIP